MPLVEIRVLSRHSTATAGREKGTVSTNDRHYITKEFGECFESLDLISTTNCEKKKAPSIWTWMGKPE
jgi:hypothetical protein